MTRSFSPATTTRPRQAPLSGSRRRPTPISSSALSTPFLRPWAMPNRLLKKARLRVSQHRLGGTLAAGGVSQDRCNSSLGERALGCGRWSSALTEPFRLYVRSLARSVKRGDSLSKAKAPVVQVRIKHNSIALAARGEPPSDPLAFGERVRPRATLLPIAYCLLTVFLSACASEQIRQQEEQIRMQQEEIARQRREIEELTAARQGEERKRRDCNRAFQHFERAQQAREPGKAAALYRQGLALCP